MKKFFSLLAAILFTASIMAVDFTLTSADEVTKDGVTVTFAKGSGSNAPAWYTAGLRLYAKNTVTISSESAITAITFNWEKQGQKAFATASASVGSYTHPSAAGQGVWTGSANSVTFTLGESGQLQLNTFTVTVGPAPKVAAPVVSGNLTFTDSVIVTMTCSTEGASIFYTLDGTEPSATSAAYAAPIKLTESTTVNAIAIKGEDKSAVATKTFTKVVVNEYDVAEAIAAAPAKGTEMFVRGVISKMQIKGANFAKYGSVNIYVKDATGAEGEFEFFNCFSFNADTFKTTLPAYDVDSKTFVDIKAVADTKGNQIRLGDTIVAFGKYELYNSTHELQTGCYLTKHNPAPVKPGDTIDVNMSKGLIYTDLVDREGWWQIYGTNDQFDISISNIQTTTAEGTYSIADLDPEYTYIGVINGTDTAYTTFVNGSVTLSVNSETKDVTVAGQLVGFDDNVYNINLVYVAPTPKTTVNVNIANGTLDDEYASIDLYSVYGEDENNVYVQLSIWAENGFAGFFTEADLDLQYVGSAVFTGELQQDIYSANITVSKGNAEGDYSITADLLCYNDTLYKVTMTIGAAQGIDAVEAATKAFKSLQNGILVIKKNNTKFNVNGQQIR